MRGRKPKPTNLKVMDGTRRDRVNDSEPKSDGRPEMPTHLDAVARKEWNRIIPILERMRVLGEADGPMLAIYCQAHSDLVDAIKQLRKIGKVVKTPTGAMKPNPYLHVAAVAKGEISKILIEFGCSPSSRSRLRVSTGNEIDELEEFLKSGT